MEGKGDYYWVGLFGRGSIRLSFLLFTFLIGVGSADRRIFAFISTFAIVTVFHFSHLLIHARMWLSKIGGKKSVESWLSRWGYERLNKR